MRDIVLKPRTPAHEPPAKIIEKPAPQKATAPRSGFSHAVEKSVSVISHSGNWLYGLLTPHQKPTIIQEAIATPLEPTKKAAKPARVRGKKRAKIAKYAKESGQKAKVAIKNPITKVTAVQVAAMIAIFGYAVSTRKSIATFETKNIGDRITQPTLQQYLPTAGDYTIPKEFNEQSVLASESGTALRLHTWVTPWNLESVKRTEATYASFSAFWGTVQEDGVGITPKAEWATWDQFKQSNPSTAQQYFLSVTGDPEHTSLSITNPEVRTNHIAQLLATVEEHGFDGIDIDYEGLGIANRAAFSDFIVTLTEAFHAHNKKVAVTLEARLANQVPMDWSLIGTTADEVRLMAYDYHARDTGNPGSIAPIGWLKEVLDYAQASIPAKKLIVGLGNYGYDWAKAEEDGQTVWRGIGISFDQALAVAQEKSSPIIRITGIDERGYDVGSTPMYSYRDEADIEHQVWFEDNQTLQAKLDLVRQYKTAGVIFWSVGIGDQAFWQATNAQ